jgi:hypothetical protein
MRLMLIPASLLLCAAPALAQAPAGPTPVSQVQQALSDPAMVDKLANTMQALSQALLDLPVGKVQAAVEGRKPTSAEKKLTVRDLGRRENRDFDRDFQRQMAETKPMIQQSMKALSEALPAVMQSLEQAGRALDRAAANMPDPTYPKR